MGEFRNVVLGFPTVLLGGALVVVAGFWVLVLVGAAGGHGPGHHGHLAGPHHHGGHSHDGSDSHPHSHGHGGSGRDTANGAGGPARAGLLSAAGLDGVPVTVVLSLLVAVAWFLSLAGSVALDGGGLHGAPRAALDLVLLAAAATGAWSVTWVLVRPLRRLFPYRPPPSRADFVGLLCTVRTGSVTGSFGQAEVASPDGSASVVQVRQYGGDSFAAGSTALIHSYDEQGEFFWIAPFDDPLGDGAPGACTGPPGPAPAG